VLTIPPVDPGDHHVDSVACETFDLVHTRHLNLLERCTLGDEVILQKAPA
jgi:hypothetical protein